jgi:hypothetical protein
MKYSSVIFLISLFACKNSPKDPIGFVFEQSKMLSEIAHNPAYEVQIIYTDIIRNGDSVSFKDYTFQVDGNKYFYPASTVKFPAAILALEKLKEMKDKGIQIGRDTPFMIEGDTFSSSIASNIAEIFAVSDNNAYNHLYEFLGRDEMNRKMKSKGLHLFQISHRLSTPDSANDTLKSVTFELSNGFEYFQPSSVEKPIEPLQLNSLEKGIGFYQNDSLIMHPFDFSLKNYFPLITAHETLKRLFFPEKYTDNQNFNLNPEDRKFLLETMALLPRESRYKKYDPVEFYDSYVKFFMFGDSKKPIPDYIKIYNKVGDAYGYLTDIAYVADSKNKIEFMLSATIHVNKDQIFNDDKYEYETVGFPFLAELGRQFYDFKLKTSKN